MTTMQRAGAAVLVLALGPGLCAAKFQRSSKPGVAPAQKAAARPAVKRAARQPSRRPAPPLSYLRENSYSLQDLITQVQANPKLRMRYANHFHIAPDQVVPYFRANLVESYVPRTHRYRVWMKRPDGSTYSVYQTFRAGTRVLSLRNGQPVLKWACGNPLSQKLPKIQKKRVAQREKKVKPNVQKRTRYVNIETPFETPRALTGVPPMYVAPPSQLTQLVTREVIPVATRRFPAAGLIPIALIPHGHGRTPPIPEPSTAVLALAGLVGASIFGRLRRT